MWSDFENETLIHIHKTAKILKKRYQRAGEFYSSLYNILGGISVVLSIISSTLSWSSSLDIDSEKNILRLIISFATLSTIIQNYYNFQDISNNLLLTSKKYTKIQYKIETLGNTHPDYRVPKPEPFFKMIKDKMNLVNENRKELSNCMVKIFYQKKDDSYSYLEETHEKYKELKEDEKLNYSKNIEHDFTEDEESDRDIP